MLVFGSSTQLLLIMLLSVGDGSAFHTDFLALVPTDGYLQSKQIEIRADKLIELAMASPKDAKGLATQLIAIRWFAENKDKLGEHSKSVKETLQALAQGKRGFARDDALVALATIENKPAPTLHPMPKGSVRSQGLEWFPDDVTLFGAFDLRTPVTAKPSPEAFAAGQALRSRFLSMIPAQALPAFFGLADQIGNFRIDRLAFAYLPDPTGQGRHRIFVRVTGNGDAENLFGLIGQNLQNAKVEQRQGPNGVHLRLISQGGGGPIFMFPVLAFVGDSDLIICGFEGGPNLNHMEAYDQVAAVMSGKKPSAVKGPFAQALQAVPEEARALVLGTMPEELRKELNRSPLGVSPLSIAMHITNGPGGGSVLSVRATFENDADAKKFSEGATQLLKSGAEAVKMLPFKLKPESVAALEKALLAVEVKPEGTGISAQVPITPAAVQALGDLVEAAMKQSP